MKNYLLLIAFTTTTTAAAATVFTTTAAAAAGGAFFTGLGNVNRKGAAIQLRTVQGGNGFLRFFGCAHGDETETTRTAAHAVHHQVGFRDRSVRCKSVVQVVFSGIEGKISNK